MGIIQAILLGIVQGATEFLPVSSSGHLLVLLKMFGQTESEILFYSVMVHLGSLIAVIYLLRWDILAMISHPTKKPFIYLVIASIPAGLVGILFKSQLEATFGGSLLGYAFLFTAILLVASEQFPNKELKLKDASYKAPILMGLFQAVATLPGISRSGSTLAGGLMSGLSRTSAARFSFMMSIPVILGSTLLEAKDAIEGGLQNIMWGSVLVCIGLACISSFFAMSFMIRLVRKSKLYGFAIYVAAFGIFVLLDQNIFHLVF